MTIDLATINFIPGQGGGGVIKSLSVTSNGVYSASAGVDGYNPVDVDVHPSESLQRTYTSNGIYNIPGEWNGVEIEVNTPVPSGVMTITFNGIYDVTSFASASVDVPQSVTGYTQKELTESICITNLNNSASFVRSYAFFSNSCLNTVDLPMCETVGNEAFKSCSSLSSVNLPVCETINDNAFNNCLSLPAINLPVCSYIGYDTFFGCNSLSSVNLPVCSYIGGEAFKYCYSLSSVNLPMCKKIDYYVFGDCRSLTTVNLPVCSYIGDGAFEGCSSLSEVNIVPFTVNGGCFKNCFLLSSLNLSNIISYSNTWAGGWVENCSNLSTITLNLNTYLPLIPYDITGLGNGTKFSSGIGSIYVQSWFYNNYINADGWSSLSSLIISVPTTSMLSYSDGVVNGMTKYIDFKYNSYLDVSNTNVVSVDLPNCEYIDLFTFDGYSNLTSISLPNCEYINNYAFRDCSSLSSVNLPVCSYIGNEAFKSCSSLSSVNLPVCSYIGNDTFKSCSSLSSVNLPVCSYIGGEAFHYCSSLSSVNLPVCKRIGYEAFKSCSSLSSVNLPVCSYIGNGAFQYCYSLSVAYIGTSIDTVCVLDGNAFDGCPALTSIYVPASLIESYKTATNWTYYSDKIFGI